VFLACSANLGVSALGGLGSQLGGMLLIDWLVVVLYAAGMLGIGVYYSFRTTSTEDYMLGGRKMGSKSIGLSLFSTLFSTITYMALPGEMINKGPAVICWMVSLPIVYLIVCHIFIPRFMALPYNSAYEVLETRLGLRVRLLGSVIFLLTRLLWMALIIHITAQKILIPVLRWDEKWTPYVAVVIGMVTLVYTFLGGIRAVVLTDVIQTIILFAGAVGALLLITWDMGGFGAWWPRTWSPNWDQQPLISLDPTVRASVAGSIVFMSLWWICTAGSDQLAIQRYLATRDAGAAKQAFLITLASNVFVTLLLAALGFALLGFFSAHPEHLKADGLYLKESLDLRIHGDRLFPYYIVRFLPPGMTGLVISALLAAAMSSLSAGVNSSCAVLSTDFIDRLGYRAASEKTNVRRAQALALLVGLVCVGLSLLMSRVTGNLMEVTTRTNHVFVAPLFGLFMMALFVPFATPFGTTMGTLAGCLAAVLIAYKDMIFGGLPWSFQWISLAALAVNLLVGIPLSLWVSAQKRPRHASSAELAEGRKPPDRD